MNTNSTLSTSDLQRRGRVVMDSITAGDHITITKYNVPHAVVVPSDWYDRAVRALFNAEVNGPDGTE